MKLFIKKYIYVIIGLFVSIIGYFYCVIQNIDLVEQINTYFQFVQSLEVSEFFLWSKVFIMFVLLNIIILMEKRKNTAKEKIYKSMLYASNHILGNFLYQSSILKMEAEENVTFNKETIFMFEECKEEAVTLLKKLSTINKIDERGIYETLR